MAPMKASLPPPIMPIRNFLFFISVIGDFRFSKFISNITVFSQSSKPVWKNRPKSATFRHGPTPPPPRFLLRIQLRLNALPRTALAHGKDKKRTTNSKKENTRPFGGHSPFVLPDPILPAARRQYHTAAVRRIRPLPRSPTRRRAGPAGRSRGRASGGSRGRVPPSRPRLR